MAEADAPAAAAAQSEADAALALELSHEMASDETDEARAARLQQLEYDALLAERLSADAEAVSRGAPLAASSLLVTAHCVSNHDGAAPALFASELFYVIATIADANAERLDQQPAATEVADRKEYDTGPRSSRRCAARTAG